VGFDYLELMKKRRVIIKDSVLKYQEKWIYRSIYKFIVR